MKTLIRLSLMQATWAWLGIILFMIMGFAKIHLVKAESLKEQIEIKR